MCWVNWKTYRAMHDIYVKDNRQMTNRINENEVKLVAHAPLVFDTKNGYSAGVISILFVVSVGPCRLCGQGSSSKGIWNRCLMYGFSPCVIGSELTSCCWSYMYPLSSCDDDDKSSYLVDVYGCRIARGGVVIVVGEVTTLMPSGCSR